MTKPTTYAVVDLETTGTSGQNDRIIQFGCVLIQNNQIIANYGIDINPKIKVPSRIETLTGLKTERLQKAPYFEDVAGKIRQLLTDCVFVAHNVLFDYQFLNTELVRCGVPALSIPAIDTVQLAQIFLTDVEGYSLEYLTKKLGFIHERPHQADSDAQVTGELLLYIEKKMRSLPLVTMKAIADLSDMCIMETGDYIGWVYQSMCQQVPTPPLAEDLQVVDGIALVKKSVPQYLEKQYIDAHYPTTEARKKQLFQNIVDYRSEQAVMMDEVYRHFTEKDGDKNLAIEAATGMGKTFGYLLPLSYLATPENPGVISTNSLVLEEQLYDNDIQLLNKVTEKPVNAVVVKGQKHYLDLERFVYSLRHPTNSKQTRQFQMTLLVWLTQTKTGDLDELQISSFPHAYWSEIRHQGMQKLTPESALYEEDFFLYLLRKIRAANIIIINHAYLCEEKFRMLSYIPKSNYLIVDEAHHLANTIQKTGTKRIKADYIHSYLRKLMENDEAIWREILALFNSDKKMKKHLRMLLETYISLEKSLEHFFHQMTLEIRNQLGKEFSEEYPLNENFWNTVSLSLQKSRHLLDIHLKDAEILGSEVQDEIKKQWNKFTYSEQVTLNYLINCCSQVDELIQNWPEVFNGSAQHTVVWAVLGNQESLKKTVIYLSNAAINNIEKTQWYNGFRQIIYTGSTLSVWNKAEYFQNSLGLAELKFIMLDDPYNYKTQARIFIPKTEIDITQLTPEKYAAYIAEVVLLLANNQRKPILVLFTSHQLLRATFEHLEPLLDENSRPVLAQGITGTRKKIFKRFLASEEGILLGADSFWEGVDLPGKALELLVIPRLPFESPGRPFVKARMDYLNAEGKSAFYYESLPKAGFRLRQGLGRLIRSKKDRGVMLVLDNRLVRKNYGKQLIRSLPPDISVTEASMNDILSEIHEFFHQE